MSDCFSLRRNDEELWSRLKASYVAYRQVVQEFSAPSVDRVGILKLSLRGSDRHVAIHLLPYLAVDELKQLLDELVFLASFSHGAIQFIRDQILRLPREWVVERIEATADPLLVDGTYDEYRRLLELYDVLDPTLTRRLAIRAIHHSDPDIQEAGQDFLGPQLRVGSV